MSNILKYNGAIRLAQLAADPAGVENGVIYYNTTSNVIRQYVNGGFQDVPDQALTLVGLALSDGNIIVGDGSNLSVVVDTASVGDIDVDSSAGLTIKSNVIVDGDINASAAIALSKLAALTASRALQSDGSGIVSVSSVTSTELGYVSGVTSAIQTQLGNKISSSEKGANNGVASLDGGGKVPASQLPNSVMELQGFWNANTNTPTLADGVGNPGDIYEVDTAGTTDFGNGNITFAVGDWAVYAADAKWHKSINSNIVSSVNGQTGIVVLDTDDIAEGSALYFTAERAQDAVGGILTDTSSIDFTYNDAGDAISAVVLPAGVDHDSLNNFVANKHIDHSAVSIATASDSGLLGGGDITATRNLSVDINGTTAETSADNADAILIYDNSATALKKMTRANFLSGITISSAGDINESTFSGLVNNTANQTVTGLSFANGVVRSFKAQVSIAVSATADSFANFELQGIQRGADWQMSEVFVGDSITGLSFNITTAGQVHVSIGNITGFSSASIKFRALTTGV